MTLDELLADKGRVPTGADIFAAVTALGWRVDTARGCLVGLSKSDKFGEVVRKLLKREPWRTEFLAAAVSAAPPQPRPPAPPEHDSPTRAELLARLPGQRVGFRRPGAVGVSYTPRDYPFAVLAEETADWTEVYLDGRWYPLPGAPNDAQSA